MGKLNIAGSGNNEWETPPEIFKHWYSKFIFQLDVAASEDNAKLPNYFTKDDNALDKPWSSSNWMNPPYGKPEEPCKRICTKDRCLAPTPEKPNRRGYCISAYEAGLEDFVRKAHTEAKEGRLTVGLLPVATSTKWWQQYVAKADHIHFYPHRINFLRNGAVVKGVAFDPCIVIWGLHP